MRSEYAAPDDADEEPEVADSKPRADVPRHPSWDGQDTRTRLDDDQLRRELGRLASDRIDDALDSGKISEQLDFEGLDERQKELASGSYGTAELTRVRGGHTNEVYKAKIPDGMGGIYKPLSGEGGYRESIDAGTYWRREVAAYEVGQILGLDRVPVTVPINGPEGLGSLQEDIDQDARQIECYEPEDRQEVGVLDYILGSTDRHAGNVRTLEDGSPAAIDNGFAFPADVRDSLRSVFFSDALNTPLNTDIVEKLRNADTNALVEALERRGVPALAIEGVLIRLEEARSGFIRTEFDKYGRTITSAWRARIIYW